MGHFWFQIASHPAIYLYVTADVTSAKASCLVHSIIRRLQSALIFRDQHLVASKSSGISTEAQHDLVVRGPWSRLLSQCGVPATWLKPAVFCTVYRRGQCADVSCLASR